jgi:hypothetical protein
MITIKAGHNVAYYIWPFANKSDLRAIVNHAQRSGPVGSAAVDEMSAQRDMIVVE